MLNLKLNPDPTRVPHVVTGTFGKSRKSRIVALVIRWQNKIKEMEFFLCNKYEHAMNMALLKKDALLHHCTTCAHIATLPKHTCTTFRMERRVAVHIAVVVERSCESY